GQRRACCRARQAKKGRHGTPLKKAAERLGFRTTASHMEIQAAGTAAARYDVTLLRQGRKKTRALS
ncbi:MAG: hypothetical protein WA750_11270, partial [Pseudolabrys sp.]